MAALSFHSNWPTTTSTFHQHHHHTATAVPPPPPDFLPLMHENHHDHFSTFNTYNNNLSFHNYPPNFPTLSSSFYNNNNNNVFDHHQEFFLPINPMESYPFVHGQDLCPMDQTMQPGLPEMYGFGSVCNGVVGGDAQLIKEDANGGGAGGGGGGGGGKEERISAQSVAARVRRRKISDKTLELGKLVPGGHKMTTAEMLQAAYKYIKFLQAQVGVFQLMSSSPELGEELQALVTSPAVQEKLYTEGKCIVSQTLAKTIAER